MKAVGHCYACVHGQHICCACTSAYNCLVFVRTVADELHVRVRVVAVLGHASMHKRSLLNRVGSRATDFQLAVKRDLRELDRQG